MKQKYSLGIDEAGRGPVIGPMVMAIVACTSQDKEFLNKIGVKDSKQVSPAKRTKLARIIKERCAYAIIKASPKEIDNALQSTQSSLNYLEADVSKKLIKKILKKLQDKNIATKEIERIMLDLPAKNKEDYLQRVRKGTKELFENIKIEAEFKADENYVDVSAASILAKTTRDASMKTLSKKIGLKLGSGYPADPNTKKAIAENYEELRKEGILRTTWKTIERIEEKKQQKQLTSF